MVRPVVIVSLALAGCANLPGPLGQPEPEVVVPEVVVATPPADGIGPVPRPELDGSVETVVPEVPDPPAVASGDLGRVTVALGDPAEAGLWVKTDLVEQERPGRVTAENGASVDVTLRPLEGTGGAQISLAALQALGLPLAGLAPVTVAPAG